ncbi:MAG: hypothetical protein DRP87_08570 [Spirochaetes bacterium]|nr:MAG: hypothetical protein DRP87_08570 [Spirochaetota bacterium]
MGKLPGTLIYTGDRKEQEIDITLIVYDEHGFEEKRERNMEEILSCREKQGVKKTYLTSTRGPSWKTMMITFLSY